MRTKQGTKKRRHEIISTLKYDFLGLLAISACHTDDGFASMRHSIDRMMTEYEEKMRVWRGYDYSL